MYLLFISFIAGLLTSLSPCVLPLLPVIIGGSLTDEKDRLRPYFITGSLFVSLIIFTMLLKASTVAIGVPPEVWKIISGVIVLLFGIVTIWPTLWERIAIQLNLRSNRLKG